MAFKEFITRVESPVSRAKFELLKNARLEQGQGREGIEGLAENRAWAETAEMANGVKSEIDAKLTEKYIDSQDLDSRTLFEIGAIRADIVEPMSAQRIRAQGVENIVAGHRKREPERVKVDSPWENGYLIDCGDAIGVRVFFYPPWNKTYMRDPAIDNPGVSAIGVMGGARVEIKQPDGQWRRSRNAQTVRSFLNYISAVANTPGGKR